MQPIESERRACSLMFPWSVEHGKIRVQGGNENVLTDGRHLTTAERVFIFTTDNQVYESQRNARPVPIGLPGNNHGWSRGRLRLLDGFRLRPRPCPTSKICAHLFCAPKP